MTCQNCGAEIPEGKIYCEKCGTAIQMVPDYNPIEDIIIGKEQDTDALFGKKNIEEEKHARTLGRRVRYGLAGLCLILLGVFAYRISYGIAHGESEETLTESEVPVMPELLEEPKLSVLPGEYEYSPRLFITHEQIDQGDIYYTTDGTTPDEHSQLYRGAIEIGEGITILRAVFIRSDGAESEEVSGTYEVVFDNPQEPVFSVPSGTYTEGGFRVSITGDGDSEIYYTTDGVEPDGNSRLYTGPVYISPGLTVLQAVAISEDGGISGIVEAIYNVSENPGPPAVDPGAIPQ